MADLLKDLDFFDLDEMLGQPLQDLWGDISPLNSQAAERLGQIAETQVDDRRRAGLYLKNLGGNEVGDVEILAAVQRQTERIRHSAAGDRLVWRRRAVLILGD